MSDKQLNITVAVFPNDYYRKPGDIIEDAKVTIDGKQHKIGLYERTYTCRVTGKEKKYVSGRTTISKKKEPIRETKQNDNPVTTNVTPETRLNSFRDKLDEKEFDF